MSQFFIIASKDKPSPQTSQIHILNMNDSDEYIKNATQSLSTSLTEKNFYQIQDSHDNTSDFLFTEAQSQLIEGIDFEKTRLYSVIMEMYKAGASLYFWYGSDSADLPIYENITKLIDDLKIEVMKSTCEFYGKLERK